ncbi:RNA:NAD 2'-phosphotransferase [Lachnospiraceae bacterium TWA4]|nr:RNA:NAD 2'-phosphotransferase [Lachnospiraceae bacterium TWA4]
MAKEKTISTYLCYLLRHHPESIGLAMDKHGWVDVNELIEAINNKGKYQLDKNQLKEIVKQDSKGRYRLNEDESRIKCCQGHSIPWIELELRYDVKVPKYLYHGTTTIALEKIKASGEIKKMERHAVHLHTEKMAWQSAKRWHLIPVVLKIDAEKMCNDGYQFGISENDVWCVEKIPIQYIEEEIYGYCY